MSHILWLIRSASKFHPSLEFCIILYGLLRACQVSSEGLWRRGTLVRANTANVSYNQCWTMWLSMCFGNTVAVFNIIVWVCYALSAGGNYYNADHNCRIWQGLCHNPSHALSHTAPTSPLSRPFNCFISLLSALYFCRGWFDWVLDQFTMNIPSVMIMLQLGTEARSDCLSECVCWHQWYVQVPEIYFVDEEQSSCDLRLNWW